MGKKTITGFLAVAISTLVVFVTIHTDFVLKPMLIIFLLFVSSYLFSK
jgi:hypothetical protein